MMSIIFLRIPSVSCRVFRGSSKTWTDRLVENVKIIVISAIGVGVDVFVGMEADCLEHFRESPGLLSFLLYGSNNFLSWIICYISL